MNRYKSLMLFAVSALGLILAACAASPVSGPTLTEQDAGHTVEVRPGGLLDVTLDGNPTTGYQWEVDSVDSAVLKQVGEPTFKADSTAVGSGGKVTLHFQGIAAGQTTLKLIYHRSFEKNVPPAKTFEVTVTVK